jgi:uncharacterized membrane protein
MTGNDAMFVFVGAYDSEDEARADYELVKGLHALDAIGSYDAAVVTKDDNGKVHVNKDETTTRHGAWGGAGVGALVGLLFPPSIVVTAVAGAALGGVSGHLWKGLSRSDVKAFGDVIDAGQAALVVVGQSTIEDALDKATKKAEKKIAKQLDVSVDDVDRAIRESAAELG